MDWKKEVLENALPTTAKSLPSARRSLSNCTASGNFFAKASGFDFLHFWTKYLTGMMTIVGKTMKNNVNQPTTDQSFEYI